VPDRAFRPGGYGKTSLVGFSSRGKQLKVKNTGLMIQLEQPAAVIDAIREVMEQVRE
jgi:hypothetical protein